MTIGKLIETIQLITPYYERGFDETFAAEHDQIYLYRTDVTLPEVVIQGMINLGWHQEVDRDDEDDENASCDFKAKHYDPCESWTAYV